MSNELNVQIQIEPPSDPQIDPVCSPLPCPKSHRCPADQQKAIEWARNLLDTDDWLILDTESTGKEASSSSIVQIAVLSPKGEVLFNSHIRPASGARVSALLLEDMEITRKDLKNASSLEDVLLKLVPIIGRKRIISYSADWREEILHWNCQRMCVEKPKWIWIDAMRPFSAYVGVWWESKNDYKFQALPSVAHESVTNCRETLHLIRRLAASEPTGGFLRLREKPKQETSKSSASEFGPVLIIGFVLCIVFSLFISFINSLFNVSRPSVSPVISKPPPALVKQKTLPSRTRKEHPKKHKDFTR